MAFTRNPNVRLDDFDPALRKVRTEKGMASKIARACGVSRPAVWRWRRVPPKFVHRVEEVTGIARHKIRPDLYPKAREAS